METTDERSKKVERFGSTSVNYQGWHQKNNNNIPSRCFHASKWRFCCFSCREDVCGDCSVRFHKSCQIMVKDSYLRNVYSAKAKELKNILRSRVTQVENVERRFTEECLNMRNFIERRTQSVILDIIQEEKALLERLNLITAVKRSSYSKEVKRCKEAIGEVCNWEEDSSIVNSFAALKKRVNSLVKKMEKMESVKESKVYFTFTNGLGEITLSASAKFSCLDIGHRAVANVMNKYVLTIKNDLGETVKNAEHYTLCVKLVDKKEGPVFFFIRNLRNGSFSINFLPISKGIIAMHATLDSVPIPSCVREIEVLEDSENLVRSVTAFGEAGGEVGQFARPWGVCCDETGRIMVADRCNHRIQIFTADGVFLLKFGKEGSKPGELNRPTGITVDAIRRIIVADKDNHRIQLFDSEGRYITHFGRFENEENNLIYPWDVAVTDECHIAVTESKQRRVRLFTDTGIELLRFNFTDEFDLEVPRGIAVFLDGSFLITDFNKHAIVLLSKHFDNPLVLGTEGIQPQEFYRPQSIACDGAGLFAVSDCKNHRIQIFKNNIVCKIIGKLGTGNGELDCPQGIAFHPDGKLIVVDYGNSRIQIFDIN